MMRIAVIGASAGLGLETVKTALSRNHEVTTLSRSHVNVPDGQAVTEVLGSATEEADLTRAIAGADAVIVTLGLASNRQATTLFSDCATLLAKLNADRPSQVPFLFVSGFGAGASRDFATPVAKLLLNYVLRYSYADKTRMEEIVASSSLNWIVVRPGRLLDGKLTGNYRTENSLFRGIKIGGINRADVAAFLVGQAENPTELGKYVAISAE
jgi:putative NADH-flavin reductase